MKIEEFITKYAAFKDADKIEITCDHPNHTPKGEILSIGKQPAKRNIMKKGGIAFICRECHMKFNNPMQREDSQPSRQTTEFITVRCPHPDHDINVDRNREMQRSSYFGKMEEPYEQICGSCVQKGKEIPQEQRDKISESLTGRTLSPEHVKNMIEHRIDNPEWAEKANRNLIPGKGAGWNTGMVTPEETRQKQSEAMKGRTYTEEHCKNISEGRKKMLDETGGFTQEHRDNIRKATLLQYAKGFNPNSFRISGSHNSPKAGKIWARSAYEFKAFEHLDADEDVITYIPEDVKINYVDPKDGVTRVYIVDIKITHKDNSVKLIEVKPAKLVDSPVNTAKICAGRSYAQEMGWQYEVWTEIELHGPVYNQKNISDYSVKLRARLANEKGENVTEDQINEEIRIKRNEKSKNYQSKARQEKITIKCEFCDNTEHKISVLAHRLNIEKNGRYICTKENGHINGSKPKPKKVNPHEEEGKKKCTGKCGQIKDLDDFSEGKSECKKCRSDKYNEKYHMNKKEAD